MPPPLRPSDEDLVYSLTGGKDDSQVRQRRFDELMRLGVDACDAALLVTIPDVAHRVEDLILAGCPPHTAARIVT